VLLRSLDDGDREYQIHKPFPVQDRGWSVDVVVLFYNKIDRFPQWVVNG
jgi:hypothetical protein